MLVKISSSYLRISQGDMPAERNCSYLLDHSLWEERCSEETLYFKWISGHQEANKFGLFWGLESAISTEIVILQTQNNFSSLL